MWTIHLEISPVRLLYTRCALSKLDPNADQDAIFTVLEQPITTHHAV